MQLHQVIHDVNTTLFGVQLVEVHKQKQTRVNDCQKLVGKVSVRNILKTMVTVEDATVVHHIRLPIQKLIVFLSNTIMLREQTSAE